jgi:hypothetical protein
MSALAVPGREQPEVAVMRHDRSLLLDCECENVLVGRAWTARRDRSHHIEAVRFEQRTDGRRHILVEQEFQSADLSDHITTERARGVSKHREHLLVTDAVGLLNGRQTGARAELFKHELDRNPRSGDARLSAQHLLRRLDSGHQRHRAAPTGARPASSISLFA